MNLMLVDIGNSRIKFYYKGKYHAYGYNSEWQIEMDKIACQLKNHTEIVYSSVNEEMELEFLKTFKKCSCKIEDAKNILERQNRIKLNAVLGAGTDRVLGIFGGLKFYNPPLITVDCGTAVTVNALDSSYNFIGGAIFPGLETQIKSLAEKTSKLPEIRIDKVISSPGKNTEDAIRFGILSSVSGGIIESINDIKNDMLISSKTNIVLTGGYAHLLLHKISNKFDKVFYKENLVIEGIKYLHKI